MKWKKGMAVLTAAACLAGCLAGCSGSGSDSGSKESSKEESTEIKDITWMYAQMSGMIPEDLQKVEDALNEITEEKIQVHVNLNPVSFADYQNQISLIMASQEKMDIITTAGSNIWSALLSQRQLTPLNDLLDEYGADIKDTVPYL